MPGDAYCSSLDSELSLGPLGPPGEGPPGMDAWSPYSGGPHPPPHHPHPPPPPLGPGNGLPPNMSPGGGGHPPPPPPHHHFIGRHSPGGGHAPPISTAPHSLMPLDAMSGIPRLLPAGEDNPQGYMDYPPSSNHNHVEVY